MYHLRLDLLFSTTGPPQQSASHHSAPKEVSSWWQRGCNVLQDVARGTQISRVLGIVELSATWRTLARIKWWRSHVYCQAAPAVMTVSVKTGTPAQHHSTLLALTLFATGLMQCSLRQMCIFLAVLIICDVELSATLASGACRVLAFQQ